MAKEKRPFLPEFLTKKKGKTEQAETFDPTTPFISTLPGINLIPQAVLDGYALQKLQAQFAKVIVILIVAIVALWGALFALEKIVEMRVNNAQAEVQEYGNQVKALQPYADYRDSVQSKRATIGEKMSTEVDTGAIISELNKIASNTNVSLSDSIIVEVLNGPAEGAEATTAQTTSECSASNPFATEQSIGCVTFVGTGDRTDVAEFIKQVEANPNFNNTFVPSSSSGETNEFSGYVNFTGGFLTNAYSDLLTDEAPAETEETETTPAEEVQP